jgi:hypothetical protein
VKRRGAMNDSNHLNYFRMFGQSTTDLQRGTEVRDCN